MRKYFSLSVASFLGLGLIYFFYAHGEGRLARDHQSFSAILGSLKQIETNLEKDTLQARSFLTLTYDPIVSNSIKILEICRQLRDDKDQKYAELSSAINEYCGHIDNKIQSIEMFKSKNAILKNSLYYLQMMASEHLLNESQTKNSDETYILSRQLMRTAIAYYLIPTQEARSSLSILLDSAAKLHSSNSGTYEDLQSIALHATRILHNKVDLDQTVLEIVNSDEAGAPIQKLSQRYSAVYSESENFAMVYRQLLFYSSISLFVMIIFGVFRLWKSSKALADANLNLESRVQEKTKDLRIEKNSMKTILDNVDQGLFTVEANGRIANQCSQSCDDIFSKDIRSLHLAEILCEDSALLDSLISMIFEERKSLETLLGLFPEKIGYKEKSLKIDYKVMREGEGIKSILCIVTDMTPVELLEKQKIEEAQRNATVIKVLANKNDFIEVIEMTDALKLPFSNKLEAKRKIHTLKGSFSFLECRWLADICHECENNIEESDDFNLSIQNTYEILRNELEKFVAKNLKVLKINSEEQMIEIGLSAFAKALRYVSTFNPDPKIYNAFDSLMLVPLEDELYWLNDAFLKTAEGLGKTVSPVVFDSHTKVPTKVYGDLFRSFIHIARNAADHGIESDEVRKKNGKSVVGNLSVSFFETASGYVIQFKDNGQGVNIERFATVLKKDGIDIAENKDLVLEYIFDSGVSSADEITLTSGRGVGLGAVRAEARKLGGDCYAVNYPGQGFMVVVEFKKIMFSQMTLGLQVD